MRTSIVFTSLFAAFVAAAPTAAPNDLSTFIASEIETRQTRTIRVLLAEDSTDTAVQADVLANGKAVAISGTFRLGDNVTANRAGVVSGSGSCKLFKDKAGKQLVATIKSGGDDVEFGKVALGGGVIVCQ